MQLQPLLKEPQGTDSYLQRNYLLRVVEFLAERSYNYRSTLRMACFAYYVLNSSSCVGLSHMRSLFLHKTVHQRQVRDEMMFALTRHW
jgi:hypothetical protein